MRLLRNVLLGITVTATAAIGLALALQSPEDQAAAHARYEAEAKAEAAKAAKRRAEAGYVLSCKEHITRQAHDPSSLEFIGDLVVVEPKRVVVVIELRGRNRLGGLVKTQETCEYARKR